jgi:hypothetical protein
LHNGRCPLKRGIAKSTKARISTTSTDTSTHVSAKDTRLIAQQTKGIATCDLTTNTSSASECSTTECAKASHEALLQATSQCSGAKTHNARRKRCTDTSSSKSTTKKRGDQLLKNLT